MRIHSIAFALSAVLTIFPEYVAVYGAQLPPGAEERQVARCLASGLPPLECIGETLSRTVGDLLGAAVPAARPQLLPPGLRMNGNYPGQGGFAIGFFTGSDTAVGLASITCGEKLQVPGHPYGVELKANQAQITVQNAPRPFVLTLQPDGTLAGPTGPTEIAGSVIVGYETRQTTQQKPIMEYEVVFYPPQSVTRDPIGNFYAEVPVTVSVPITEPRTERCTIGTLKAAPATAPIPEGLAGFLSLLSNPTAPQRTAPPGLRVVGTYTGQDGTEIEFRSALALVGCGEVLTASSYTVERRANQVTIRIEDPGAKPILLELRPDGRLAGPGPMQLAGRVFVGMTSDPNNPIAYEPRTASCNMGTLAPGRTPPTGDAAAGTAAARTAVNSPSPPPADNAPVANAVLSVVSGIPSQPGATNPLGGQSFFLLKETVENALRKGGFQPPPGMTALRGFTVACTNGEAACGQGASAMAASAVGAIRADASGKGQFQALAPGIYHLFVMSRYNNQPVLWEVRVDLKPGANSVPLDLKNQLQIQ